MLTRPGGGVAREEPADDRRPLLPVDREGAVDDGTIGKLLGTGGVEALAVVDRLVLAQA